MARGGALSTGYSFSRRCGLSNYTTKAPGCPLGGSYIYAGVTRGSVPSSFSQMQLNTSRSDYKTSSLGITLSMLWEFSRPPEVVTGRGQPSAFAWSISALHHRTPQVLGRSKGFFPTIKMIIRLLQLCTIQVSVAWSVSLLPLPLIVPPDEVFSPDAHLDQSLLYLDQICCTCFQVTQVTLLG